MNFLAAELSKNLSNPEDWYGVSKEQFMNHFGVGILHYYDNSLSTLLLSLYPELDWKPWKFGKVANGFWKERNNQVAYMMWFTEEVLKIKREAKEKGKDVAKEKVFVENADPEDYYNISREDFIKNFGAGLLHQFSNSPYVLLRNIFPNLEFLPWKFSKLPSGFWESLPNQKQYMKWLSKRLNREEGNPESWFSVTRSEFLENHGGYLLSLYDDSFAKLLHALYPDKEMFLEFWRFSSPQTLFWSNLDNQRKYFSYFANCVGLDITFAKLDGFYSVSADDFHKHHGSYLLSKYGESPYQLIVSLYPELESRLLPWRFVRAPGKFWESLDNRKKYLFWLCESLGMKEGRTSPEEWYAITREDFLQNDGSYLLSRYGNSPYALLNSILPELNFLPWKFVKAPGGFWEKLENQQRYLSWLGGKLGFAKPEDWYNITAKDFEDNHGRTLLDLYSDSPSKILRANFPESGFLPFKFCKSPIDLGKDEGELEAILKYIEKEMQFATPEDWYRVSKENLDGLGVFGALSRAGGLKAVLPKHRPSVLWTSTLLNSG